MKRFAVPLVLMLVLAGCGNDSPINPPTNPPTGPDVPTNPGGPTFPGLPTVPGTPVETSISGTVTAPPGGDITNTYVFACAQSDTQCASVQSTIVDTVGAYSFGGLQTEPYAIFAFNDIDASNSLSSGDYFGIHSADGTNPAFVTPPASAINITLQVEGGSTPPPVVPDPPDIGTGDSISGTVSAPEGATAAGATRVLACYLADPDDPEARCDESLSMLTELPPGSSFPYTVSGLTAGQYLVIAAADSDGNGSFMDADDFFGAYPSLESAQVVSPPATGIDIQMFTNSELGLASAQYKLSAVKVFIRK